MDNAGLLQFRIPFWNCESY